MRLIDADELKSTVGMFTYHGEGEDDSDYIAVRAYRCELIEKEAPTVKAIPIEWIEKWFSQFYGKQGLEWNRCKRFMLKDWEKENEQNKKNTSQID